MNQHVPQGKTSLKCPDSKKNCHVTYEVNVFRGATRSGLKVIDCSELPEPEHSVPCNQDCIDTPEAKQIHEQAVRTHQNELATIGSNVIG